MSANFTRRDFLKLSSLLTASGFYNHSLRTLKPSIKSQQSNPPNIIICVFDSLTARNMGMHGYPRDTMPLLSQLAESATVFHRHTAPANYTTPSTASLLTSNYLWAHRAFNHNETMADEWINKNLFQVFDTHHRVAYSHNTLANTFFQQLETHISEFKPQKDLFLSRSQLLDEWLKNDSDTANVSWARILKQDTDNLTYSLLLSRIYNILREQRFEQIQEGFPRGLPNINIDDYFLLEDSIDWTTNISIELAQSADPFIGYYHFLPPHFPYKTREEFYDVFANDGYIPLQKPFHRYHENKSRENLLRWRLWYDEFILYVDYEFSRMFHMLKESGTLDNTWLIFTSDHGEAFERGTSGHLVPILHQCLTYIPLLIWEPGQTSRKDIYQNTSTLDILPTLLSWANIERPDWVMGEILPPYNSETIPTDRSIYAYSARDSELKYGPLGPVTVSLLKGEYKLMYYTGYETEAGDTSDYVEFYNLLEDPEEASPIDHNNHPIGAAMLEEILDELDRVNAPYQK